MDGATTGSLPTDAEVERAIASVTGVAEAGVTRAADTGRGRLRIRLHPGEDAERVAWAVAATLRERFGIALDPAAIHAGVTVDDPDPLAEAPIGTGDTAPTPTPAAAWDVEPDAEGADAEAAEGATRTTIDLTSAFSGGADDASRGATAAGARAGRSPADEAAPVSVTGEEAPDEAAAAGGAASEPRPRIRDLDVRRGISEAEVTAILHLDGVEAVGRVRAVPTTRGVLRGVAEATVAALRDLSNTTLVLGVDSVSQVAPSQDTATVNVLLTYLSERDEETLVGCSLVRGDLERAVMRATLDAVNRRLAPSLAPVPVR